MEKRDLMRKSIREGKLIYHLTDIRNVESIVQKGILSRSTLLKKGMKFKDVADQEIIKFRKEHDLNDYVPFYFFSGNPFDGKVQKAHASNEYVYLCMYRNNARDKKFKIIPRHPLNMNPFTMYNYDKGMEKIDWNTMDLRDYSDYECKEICMAECVHKGDLKISDLDRIHVRNDKAQKYVEKILKKNKVSNIKVTVSPNYFVKRRKE